MKYPDLIYMRARYYDPSVGRFVSEDPAGDGTNWYAYCRSNPTSLLDFTGKDIWEGDTVRLIALAVEYSSYYGREAAAALLRDVAKSLRNQARHHLTKGGEEAGVATGVSGLGGSFNSEGDLLFVKSERDLLIGATAEFGAVMAEQLAALLESGGNPLDLL